MYLKACLLCYAGLIGWSGFAATAHAGTSVLTGMFDGSESTLARSADANCETSDAPFRIVNFAVSQAGTYRFHDSFFRLYERGLPHVVPEAYNAGYDPAGPGNLPPLSAWDEVRGMKIAHFEANETYVLVVSQTCSGLANHWPEGAWAVSFTGPGSVLSESLAQVPKFTSGRLDDSGPRMNKICGDLVGHARYRKSGPVRVSLSGTYYFSSSPGDFSSVCLGVYTADLDPARPDANRMTLLDVAGSVDLVAGQDYYFVVQRVNGDDAGEFHYVLAPPAPFRINAGLADSWYDPATPGQGFFLDVMESHNEIFLGWFTYATDPVVGDSANHRWLTAFGPFAGRHAALKLEWTKRNLVEDGDSGVPAHEQYIDGAVDLEFFDCSTGQVNYAWGSDKRGRPLVAGVIPIQRMTDDSAGWCEELYRGPGMPGRL